MLGLPELQRDFACAVLTGEATVTGHVRRNGLDPVQRLAIYRNNTMLGLTEALRATFPAVNGLVGEGFFNALARTYIRRHPPESGCLLEYGSRFPAFAAEWRAARSLVYLPDVARLEWLCQEAYHEADGVGLDPSVLAAVPAKYQGDIRFRLHPSARLMESDYPVRRIWEVNQPGFSGDDAVSLQEGGCRLLLFRRSLEVEIHALDAGDYALLTSLADDATITAALERAANADIRFDLMNSLKRWIESGLFTDFTF